MGSLPQPGWRFGAAAAINAPLAVLSAGAAGWKARRDGSRLPEADGGHIDERDIYRAEAWPMPGAEAGQSPLGEYP